MSGGFSCRLFKDIFYHFSSIYLVDLCSQNQPGPSVLFSRQVALRDLQMRGMPSNLLPGEPLCSPRVTVLLESTVQLLRRLHQCEQWASHINQHIHSQLELIGPLLKEDDAAGFSAGQKQL